MSYTKGLWSQGRTLLTNATMRYTKEEWELNESIEKRTIITHFLESDAGKSRIPIANCFSEEDAERIVACVNACMGITTEALKANVVAYVLSTKADMQIEHQIFMFGKVNITKEKMRYDGHLIWEDDDGQA